MGGNRIGRLIVVTCAALGGQALAQDRVAETRAVVGVHADRPRLAVVGFEMEGPTDPRDAWLATAVEETLAWRLRRVPALVVIPPVRVHQARQELQDDGAALPPWPRVVALLGARRVITGRCLGTADVLTVRLAVAELAPDPQPLAETTLPSGRLGEVLDAATRWVLAQFGVGALPAVAERLAFSPPARSPSAPEYYARAVLAARGDNFKDARYYALQAVDYDARYRPALALLAQLELQSGATGLAAAGARLRTVGDLAQMSGDALDWAAAELGQGVVLQLTGAFDAAYTRMETSLAMSCEQDAPYGQLAAMNSLCDLYLTRRWPPGFQPPEAQARRFERQNLRRAAEWLEAGIELLGELGDVVAEAPAANKLALIYERLDEKERALAMHRRALAAAERTGSRRNQAAGWLYIAQWHQREQQWDPAVAAARRAAEFAPDGMKPVVELTLAKIHQSRGAPAEALAQYEQAWVRIRDGKDLDTQLACARQVAELRMQLGKREAALAVLQEAIDLAHALERPDEATLRETLAEWSARPP